MFTILVLDTLTLKTRICSTALFSTRNCNLGISGCCLTSLSRDDVATDIALFVGEASTNIRSTLRVGASHKCLPVSCRNILRLRSHGWVWRNREDDETCCRLLYFGVTSAVLIHLTRRGKSLFLAPENGHEICTEREKKAYEQTIRIRVHPARRFPVDYPTAHMKNQFYFPFDQLYSKCIVLLLNAIQKSRSEYIGNFIPIKLECIQQQQFCIDFNKYIELKKLSLLTP